MYYDNQIIDEVCAGNDIVDVIGAAVHLEHRGSDYVACCPFHNERTPSFHVSRTKQLYHCFGCGEAGSVLTFVQKYERMEFPEAVEYLARRINYALPQKQMSREEKAVLSYKARLKEVNKAAAGYYYRLLRSPCGKGAMEYLTKRGLSPEIIRAFGLGYSPANGEEGSLVAELRKNGFNDRLIYDAGLLKYREGGGGYDVFRGRVIFPIMDQNSKVIGFGGRVMGDGTPKYINSKETDIYEKRRHLYGFHLARRSKREGFILCEGYMDVIAMHQAGFDHAVASLGTAFTPQQAMLIKRLAKKVYLAYDSDGAGVTAAKKAIPILTQAGMSVRVINMEPYKDPDEFIKNLGADAFQERIEQAESSVMYLVRQSSKKYNQQDPEERTLFQQDILEILGEIQDPLARNNYIESICHKYHMDKNALTQAVNAYGLSLHKKHEYEEAMAKAEEIPGNPAKATERRDTENQQMVLTLLATYPDELFPQIKGRIKPEHFGDKFYSEVANKLFLQYEQQGRINIPQILRDYEDEEEQQRVAKILQFYLPEGEEQTDYSRLATETMRRFKQEWVNRELTNLSDFSRMQELTLERGNISKWNITLVPK